MVLIVLLATATVSLFPANGATLKSDDLFQPDKLLEIQIKMPAADWEKLRSESDRRNAGFGQLFGGSRSTGNRFNLYKADITLNGSTIKNVGIRTKGFIGSLNPDRPSFKVKFDEYVDQSPIEGLDRLTLNNNVQDESLASQYLTYTLFNKAGVPAPRVNYAKVTVNEEYLGVYSHVESVREPFIQRHFGSFAGELYEGTIADFYPKAVENIEAKNKRSKKKRTQAINLAQILETKENFNLEEAEKHVNIDQFLKFWVMETLLGFWDGYTNNQNNYYAYSNPMDENRFHFVPWGADGAFTDGRGPFSRFGGDDNAPATVYSQSMLANRLFQLDEIPPRYKAVLEDILLNVWKEEDIKTEINRIHTLTRNHLHPRQNRIDQGVDRLTTFVEKRRSKFESELEDWPVTVSGGPRIPAHTVEIGQLNGTFETDWYANRLDDVVNHGKSQIQLTLNGEQVTFSKLGVAGQPEEPPRQFGGRRGRPERVRESNPTVTFLGVRKKDGQHVSITLTIDREQFKAGKKEVPFRGSLVMFDPNESQNGFNNERFRSMKSLEGALILSEAEMKAGANIVGTLTLKVNENRGGFFGGGRSRGPRR
ncbi:MAG: CotH kinase family protein [Verrucomicrobia bacterium]|nr:CotH kinase family protein [Verrucomicrobiota bacterium]